MDLHKAKLEAKTRSLANKGKTIYINGSTKGDVALSDKPDGNQTLMSFANGAEIPLPKKVLEPKIKLNKTKVVMEKKKVVAKKSDKKVLAKKSNVARKAVVVSGPEKKMTGKQLRAEVVAGSLVFNKAGKKIPCTMLAEKFPKKEFTVKAGKVDGKKAYQRV